MSIWPPFPPGPQPPRRTPWRPEPRPPAPVSVSWSLVVDARPDWLTERLVEQRLVALAGELDREAANQATAALALLDASGDDPVQLRLSGVSADLDTALTLVDTVDLMTVPVHATCVGTLTGAAIAILAVADHRAAGPHAALHLREPPSPRGLLGRDLEAQAENHRRQLRRLQERIASACHRPVDAVAAHMRRGRVLTAEEARGYGLVDSCTAGPTRPPAGSTT